MRLIGIFIRTSFQEAAAYRTNFFISLFTSLLNFGTGILGILVLFGQIGSIHGWDLDSTLALLGVYLIVSALRGLFLGPGFDSLAGMEGEIWSGVFDFTLLRPLNTQFFVSFRKWCVFTLVDLLLGIAVLVVSIMRLGTALSLIKLLSFLGMLVIGFSVLYSILLLFAALVFWSPGVLFTWIFDGFFQMARYPNNLYPGWLRMVLTWIVPVGVITTFPVKALNASLSPAEFFISLSLAVGLLIFSSILFNTGLHRYTSASS